MDFGRAAGCLAAVILAGLTVSCGEAPDAATRCANHVADMFDVRRGNVYLLDPLTQDGGGSMIGGAVDTEQGSESTRAFGCYFDAAGKMTVKIEVSDAE